MKTLVFGASTKPSRYSHKATNRLVAAGHEVVAIGKNAGKIGDVEILTGTPTLQDIHTITLYIRETLQPPYYDYFISLAPKRIIFNPGTENPVLFNLAKKSGIEVENACTLVLLNLDQF